MAEWEWAFESYREYQFNTVVLRFSIRRAGFLDADIHNVAIGIAEDQLNVLTNSYYVYGNSIDKMIRELRAKLNLPMSLCDKMFKHAMEQVLIGPTDNILAIQNAYNKLMMETPLPPLDFVNGAAEYRKKAASEFEGVDDLDPKLWGDGVDGFF